MKQAEKVWSSSCDLYQYCRCLSWCRSGRTWTGRSYCSQSHGNECLKVPIIAIIIGEGGSGGALALAVADRVWMLENSIYAILSPEGFASILWKDGSRAMEAAELMKITSHELLEMAVVDKVISEAGLSSKELIKNVKERTSS